jgi:hypothetical protein
MVDYIIYIYMSVHCSLLCVVRRGTDFIFLSRCTAQKTATNMNYCENLSHGLAVVHELPNYQSISFS